MLALSRGTGQTQRDGAIVSRDGANPDGTRVAGGQEDGGRHKRKITADQHSSRRPRQRTSEGRVGVQMANIDFCPVWKKESCCFLYGYQKVEISVRSQVLRGYQFNENTVVVFKV